MQNRDNSPARFFLIYIALGLASLLTIIAVSVYLRSQQNEVTWILALAILCSNFLAVLGYSTAILRREELLADPEAPDLAYYLGFSLTVGALSFSFLADLGAVKAANPQLQAALKSSLVSGSLAQFGAGLLATLIGLCFKIYLSAQQQRTSKDPTELYNQFRSEVGSFSIMLRDLSSNLSSAIELASTEIKRSGNLASISMTDMSETLQRASQVIAINITNETIASPINRFIEELESISSPLKIANQALNEFTTETNGAKIAIKSAASEYLAASQLVRQSALSIDAVSKSVLALNPELEELNIKLGEFLSSCFSGTESLKVLTQNANLAALEFSISTTKLQEFNTVVSQSIEKLKILTGDISQVSQNLTPLNAAISELVKGATNANNSSNEFSTNLLVTSERTKDLVERVDGLSLACTNSLTALQELHKATIASVSQTNEYTQSLQGSGVAAGSATTNMTLFTQSIGNANNDVNSFLKELAAGTVQYSKSVADLVANATGGSQAVGAFTLSLEETNRSATNLNVQLTGFSRATESSLSSLQNLERVAVSAAEATGGFDKTVKESSASIESSTLQIRAWSGSVESAKSEITALGNITRNYNVVAANQIKLAEEHLSLSKSFLENYNNVLTSLAKQQQLLGDLESKLNGLVGNIPSTSVNGINR